MNRVLSSMQMRLWVKGRPLEGVQGMKRALPGLRLEWKISNGGRPIALPQRDGWILEKI